jgi:hypothetical protein
MLFAAIRSGMCDEIISPRIFADFATNDLLTFYEFNEQSNTYENSRAITARITSVQDHDNDPEEIEFGCYRLAFTLVGDAFNLPVVEYNPVAKDTRLPMTGPRIR